MFGHVMGWALVWAVGRPGPWPKPLVRLLWAHWILGGFDFAKSFGMVRSGYFSSWLMASLSVYCPRLAYDVFVRALFYVGRSISNLCYEFRLA